MNLTLKIKLLPDCQQADLLLKTIKEANKACNALSAIGWEDKCFQQFKLHQKSYYTIKSSFNLSSQIIIRCISKVADSYKIDRKIKRTFRELGSISYDKEDTFLQPQ
jgi:putative transposase